MFLSFLQKYELGRVDVFPLSQKQYVVPPQQILEEPNWEFKRYEKNNALLCANFLQTVIITSAQRRRCELSCSSLFQFTKVFNHPKTYIKYPEVL
jgi:hypothetical protein